MSHLPVSPRTRNATETLFSLSSLPVRPNFVVSVFKEKLEALEKEFDRVPSKSEKIKQRAINVGDIAVYRHAIKALQGNAKVNFNADTTIQLSLELRALLEELSDDKVEDSPEEYMETRDELQKIHDQIVEQRNQLASLKKAAERVKAELEKISLNVGSISSENLLSTIALAMKTNAYKGISELRKPFFTHLQFINNTIRTTKATIAARCTAFKNVKAGYRAEKKQRRAQLALKRQDVYEAIIKLDPNGFRASSPLVEAHKSKYPSVLQLKRKATEVIVVDDTSESDSDKKEASATAVVAPQQPVDNPQKRRRVASTKAVLGVVCQ